LIEQIPPELIKNFVHEFIKQAIDYDNLDLLQMVCKQWSAHIPWSQTIYNGTFRCMNYYYSVSLTLPCVMETTRRNIFDNLINLSIINNCVEIFENYPIHIISSGMKPYHNRLVIKYRAYRFLEKQCQHKNLFDYLVSPIPLSCLSSFLHTCSFDVYECVRVLYDHGCLSEITSVEWLEQMIWRGEIQTIEFLRERDDNFRKALEKNMQLNHLFEKVKCLKNNENVDEEVLLSLENSVHDLENSHLIQLLARFNYYSWLQKRFFRQTSENCKDLYKLTIYCGSIPNSEPYESEWLNCCDAAVSGNHPDILKILLTKNTHIHQMQYVTQIISSLLNLWNTTRNLKMDQCMEILQDQIDFMLKQIKKLK
jgi:hypothetical protein